MGLLFIDGFRPLARAPIIGSLTTVNVHNISQPQPIALIGFDGWCWRLGGLLMWADIGFGHEEQLIYASVTLARPPPLIHGKRGGSHYYPADNDAGSLTRYDCLSIPTV